ncbi:flagellar export protein [Aquifex aeolicus VF5]|uniref:Flagellum-specific ATP synthase n=2 Tax=Aquifex aeolicus TaxID=63363 RepID=FLII_AQUAE|nr:RecName: Full=Flagellum-specific ATP synthase [Aquifex aeolicus VF5]AAC07494.1 flagellar export protein [Aquifex aeolicus VF5]
MKGIRRNLQKSYLKRCSEMYLRGLKVSGEIVSAKGIYLEAILPFANIGNEVEIQSNSRRIRGEVIGFSGDKVLVMPYEPVFGLRKGDKVLLKNELVSTKTGNGVVGKVVDPFGNPLDGGFIGFVEEKGLELPQINPLYRERIREVFDTGVRSVNALFTLGKGQKIGIFAGAGVGKSTLLGMITRHSKADVVVLALIGERGREVKEFLEEVLGEEGLKKSVVVVSTADQSPILKVKGAISAVVHAHHFASQGKDVLLLMDSITRLALAQREIGLAAGEPPTLKGFTPSVFQLLTRIAESCGAFKKGSITGIFTVLVEGDDISLDPIADSLMGVLDGHIILSRKRAVRGLFPAVDPVRSLSRLMPKLVSEEHFMKANFFKEVLSKFEDVEELVRIGLYKGGSNPLVDKVINNLEKVESFFKQKPEEKVNFEESLKALDEIYSLLK